MPGLVGRVAVVTGGASGIGLALAERAAVEGMTVALVDVDGERLDEACDELASRGVSVHPRVADVSDRAAVAALAKWVETEVGEPWLLINNAGVFLPSRLWEMPVEQCEFIFGVNLWGVVHGVQAFVPGMVARDSGYVVNTSSVDGLLTAPNAAIYNASKHAVVALSETLYRELEEAGSAVGVSVLCPGAIATNILDSVRHWPARLGTVPVLGERSGPAITDLMEPSQVAQITFDAITQRRFWIHTHPELYAPALRARADGVINAHNPDQTSVDPNHRRTGGPHDGTTSSAR